MRKAARLAAIARPRVSLVRTNRTLELSFFAYRPQWLPIDALPQVQRVAVFLAPNFFWQPSQAIRLTIEEQRLRFVGVVVDQIVDHMSGTNMRLTRSRGDGARCGGPSAAAGEVQSGAG